MSKTSENHRDMSATAASETINQPTPVESKVAAVLSKDPTTTQIVGSASGAGQPLPKEDSESSPKKASLSSNQAQASPSSEPGIEIPKQGAADTWNLSAARNRQKRDRRVKVVTTYRVSRKPLVGAFFRVNDDPDYQLDCLLYLPKKESRVDEEIYFIDWDFSEEVQASEWAIFFQPAELYLAIERHASKPYVHYVKRPRDGEKDNDWWESSRSIIEQAMKEWVQPYNAGTGYDFHPAEPGKIPDPVWPDTPFGEILRVAFRKNLISSWEHEVMQDLLGK